MRLVDADELRQVAQYEDITLDFLDDAPTIDAVPREKYERLLEAANEMDEALKWYQEEEDRRLSGEIDRR